ncbi:MULTISPECIES: glycosyltransferase [Pelosinus]|uniref:Glycosyl transferase family 2 n=2 Tax=Pelosinus TaxID=365348 RepID=I8REK9_9FIRM|nr:MULTISPECIES: glycosyltransferase [Pelosinus]EIW16030.1 glycosyl transferase family 2 [Pelosinus fermentans B4]EIW27264.1 glycosyl transferase family 2 [Pelosinus fermentans A11]
MRISVCMATYNGERYINVQLNSILKQIGIYDEVIILDDCSTDKTIECINFFNDKRIKIIKNEFNFGPIKAIEKALQYATGDIIILSDQDDEWKDNKVNTIVQVFERNNIDVIQHDAMIVDGKGNIIHESWAQIIKFGSGITKNFVKNTYVGCCMAFKKEVLVKVLPIPPGVQMHDQWIGIVAELHGFRVKFIQDNLINYVRHGSNASPMVRRSMSQALYGRIKFIRAVTTHYFCRVF